MVVGTESWLNEEISDNEVFGRDFTVHRRDRGSRGGGVFIAVKSALTNSRLWVDETYEMISVKVTCDKTNIQIVGIYRPPREDSKIIDKLEMYLRDQSNTKNCITVIGGDLNMPKIKWDGTIVGDKGEQDLMTEFIHNNDLVQAVQEGTRQCTADKCNLLDIFLVNPQEAINYCDTVDGISDHKAVVLGIRVEGEQVDSNTRVQKLIKHYKKADVLGIRNHLSHSFNDWVSLETDDVEDYWREFKKIVKIAEKEFIRTKRLQRNADPIFYTAKIKSLKKRCARLYRNRKYNSIVFKAKCQELLRLKKEALNNYMTNLLEKDGEGQVWNKFYKYINQKKGSINKIPMLVKNNVQAISDLEIAEMLNSQYASVFGEREKFDRSQVKNGDGERFSMSCESISRVVHGLKKHRSPGLDDISNDFLKLASKEIAPYLLILFQISINYHQIPLDWKQACVIPIHKGGCKDKPENYRPISLTSCVCKVLETLIAKYVRHKLDSKGTLVSAQHGFRKSYSCDTQLAGLIQDLTDIVDGRGETDAVLIDFSKAFDVVPHKRLVEKINRLGIDDKIVTWVDEWLTSRTQRVKVGENFSNELQVTSGVPQGSVLGPLLFLIFINDIGDNINCNIRLFADDCIIYSEIKDCDDSYKFQRNIQEIEKWVGRNKMKLNSAKSHLIKFTNKKKADFYQYTLNDEVLQYVDKCKYLGVNITNNLHWEEHISTTIKKGNSKLSFVMRHLKKASWEVREKAYTSIVRPTLEYAAIIWDPYTQQLSKAIEKVQRQAARHVLRKYGPRQSPTEMIADLGWASLKKRRTEAKLNGLYKSVVGYESWGDIARRLEAAQHRGRSDHPEKLLERGYNTNVGKYSFLADSVRAWNRLPKEVVDPIADSANKFRNKIKML